MRTDLGRPRAWARRARAFAAVPNHYWATALAAQPVPLKDFAYDRASGELVLLRLGLRLLPHRHDWFLAGYHHALALAHEAGVRFVRRGQGDLVAEVGSLRAFVETEEELFILAEIFVDGIYNLQSDRPRLILDVGMNVGFAALFFAAHGDTRVVGYEPFQATYEKASKNIALNPDLAARITTVNAALGGATTRRKAFYFPTQRGHSGFFLPSATNGTAVDVEAHEVRVESATDAVAKVLTAFPGRSLYAKIDCEGAEYEILNSISRSGTLGKLSGLIMEWHPHGGATTPQELFTLLRSEGFVVLGRDPGVRSHGLLYAIRPGAPPSANARDG